MNTQKETFASRLLDKTTDSITRLTDKYFDLYSDNPQWSETKKQFDDQYKECVEATTNEKMAWIFLVCFFCPLVAIIDYGSIVPFLNYLTAVSGGFIGWLISIFGFAIFLLLELATGWLLINSKGKPLFRFFACVLAVCVTVAPAALVFTGYIISETKTDLLFYKTIALMVASVIFHALLFFLISHVWAGIHYCIYLYKNWRLTLNDPVGKMKPVKEELQKLYPGFDRQVSCSGVPKLKALLHNRGWYLKHKLTTGATGTEYDLSDYDSIHDYSVKPKDPTPPTPPAEPKSPDDTKSKKRKTK